MSARAEVKKQNVFLKRNHIKNDDFPVNEKNATVVVVVVVHTFAGFGDPPSVHQVVPVGVARLAFHYVGLWGFISQRNSRHLYTVASVIFY